MAIARSDLDVKQDVTDALTSDIRIDATRATADVAGGVVYLRGSVPSYYEKRIAATIVNRIKGVVDVANELRVAPVAARGDADVVADVRASLRRDVWVDESKITVQVIDGVVYLGGTVDSYTQKSYAESDAWSVSGVVDVVNDVVIQPAAARGDQEIAVELRANLVRNIRIDPSRVTVDVASGAVTLRGSVVTAEQKWLVEDVAWWTAGVRDVANELRVMP